MVLGGIVAVRPIRLTHAEQFNSSQEIIQTDYYLIADKELEQKAYEQWSKNLVAQNRRNSGNGGGYCSCVIYAKALTGYKQSVGQAKYWPRNTSEPSVGGVVVTSESWAGHVAVISAVRESEFDVVEANYSRCRVTTRTIQKNNSVILGYWSNH